MERILALFSLCGSPYSFSGLHRHLPPHVLFMGRHKGTTLSASFGNETLFPRTSRLLKFHIDPSFLMACGSVQAGLSGGLIIGPVDLLSLLSFLGSYFLLSSLPPYNPYFILGHTFYTGYSMTSFSFGQMRGYRVTEELPAFSLVIMIFLLISLAYIFPEIML